MAIALAVRPGEFDEGGLSLNPWVLALAVVLFVLSLVFSPLYAPPQAISYRVFSNAGGISQIMSPESTLTPAALLPRRAPSKKTISPSPFNRWTTPADACCRRCARRAGVTPHHRGATTSSSSARGRRDW
ncbi:MAG: hypothetical protein R2856_37640 [Caldilineaceae bacterium]